MHFLQRKLSKNSRGSILIECLIAAFLDSMIMVLIAITMNTWIINYKKCSRYTERFEEGCEALMFIDYWINYNSSQFYSRNNIVYILPEQDTVLQVDKDNPREFVQGEKRIYLEDGTLKLKTKNEEKSELPYTVNVLLYDVEAFNVIQNKNVININLKMSEGVEIDKCFAKK